MASGGKVKTLGGREEVLSLASAPDGQTLAASTAKGEIELWDVASGQRRALPFTVLQDALWLCCSPPMVGPSFPGTKTGP